MNLIALQAKFNLCRREVFTPRSCDDVMTVANNFEPFVSIQGSVVRGIISERERQLTELRVVETERQGHLLQRGNPVNAAVKGVDDAMLVEM